MNEKVVLRALYVAWLVAGVMLVLAIAGRPAYGFYTALRWVCFSVFAYSAAVTWRLGGPFGALIFGALSVLFNPVVEFHFRRGVWQIMDGVSLVWLLLTWSAFFKQLNLPSRVTRLFKAVVWLIAGVMVVGYFAVWGARLIQIRYGETTLARVLETYDEQVESDGHAGIVTHAQYEFSVRGRRFSGTTESDCSVGDNITIGYNPRNPTQNHAKDDQSPSRTYFVLLLFGGAFSYHALSRSLAELRALVHAKQTETEPNTSVR